MVAHITNNYYFMQHGTPPDEAVDDNNQPHIVLFQDELEDSVSCQVFIAVEKELILETNSLPLAVFNLFASHYVFNLEYHVKAREFFIFLQDKVFEQPLGRTQFKKSATVSIHTSGIVKSYKAIVESQNAQSDQESS